MRKFVLMFVAVSTLFVGCKKEDAKQEEKKEEKIGVKIGAFDMNKLKRLSDVDVILYKNLKDLIDETNEVTRKKTDENGFCFIEGLEERIYYAQIDGKDCVTNIEDLIDNKGEKSKVVAKKTYSKDDYEFFSIPVHKAGVIVVENMYNEDIYVSLDYGEQWTLNPNNQKIFIVNTGTASNKASLNAYRIASPFHPFKTISIDLNELGCSSEKRVTLTP